MTRKSWLCWRTGPSEGSDVEVQNEILWNSAWSPQSRRVVERTIFSIYTASDALSSFYGLLKIHKPSVPLHPIVSSVGTIVHNIARFLVPILGPLAGKTEHHVKDSRQFPRR